ncbi:MAG: EAL domain-containing protein [Limnobacter sp.]|nr:EAL domain-containing protein [Limnobacter sp.]
MSPLILCIIRLESDMDKLMGLLFGVRAFSLSDILKERWVSMIALAFLVFFIGVSFDHLSRRWALSNPSDTLNFRYIPDTASDLQAEEALAMLDQAPSHRILRTQLKEYPFWVSIDHNGMQKADSILSIKSRHIYQAHCWSKSHDGKLSEVWNTQVQNSTQPRFDSGVWSIPIDSARNASTMLCKFHFVGPAHLEFELNKAELADTYRLARDTQRRGFLEGSLSLMIAVVAAMALNSQSKLFLCYGLWLIASLKMAALSEGWDHEMFGFAIALDSLPLIRKWVLLAYFASTVMLAYNLFDNMKRAFWVPVVHILFLFIALLGMLAMFAPYKLFLQIYWPLSFISLTTLLAVVVDNFIGKHNSSAVYYLIAMFITLLGSMSELLSAWFNSDVLMSYLNSSTVTLAASLMTAVSLTEHLRQIQLQRSLTAKSLKQAHEELKTVFDIAPSALFTAGMQGQILGQNSRFRSLFSGQGGHVVHECLSADALASQFKNLGATGQTHRFEFKQPAADQSLRWYELVLARNSDTLVGLIGDVTAQKDRELELEFQANHDELTGALNSRGLVSQLGRRFDSGQHDFYVCVLDISKFSRLSIAYGGEVTDQLLQALYADIYRYMCGYGGIARFGMDQFCVLIDPDLVKDASHAFTRLMDKVRGEPFKLGQRQVHIEALSLEMEMRGIKNPTAFMDALDESLRQAKFQTKKTGLAGHVNWSAPQVAEFVKKLFEVQQIKARQLPVNLTLAWQPILDLSSLSAPLYAEALLRLRNPDGSLSPAINLLNAAEQCGYSGFLDEWVIDRALTDLSIHADQLQNLHTLSVNVSPYSINDENFLNRVLELLKRHRNVAHKLCLEVTEVGMLINLAQIQRFFTEVHSLGVRVALDDFGAGYSNFNYAIDLRVDVIKIDGGIIKNILTHPESFAVVKAIVGLSHDLGCKCVAEWVEDFDVLHELHEVSVDYIQGYFVSEAVLPEMFFGAETSLDLMRSAANIVKLKSLEI